MKAFAGGRLFNEKDSSFDVSLTPVECIEYALTGPGVKSVFIGIRNINELNDCLKYYSDTDDEKDYAKVLVNAPKHSFEGKCTYCRHCAPCPLNINVAMVNKLYDLASIHDMIPESIKEHYNLSNYASSCIECRECEKRCPFNVNVVRVMNSARSLFGK